MYRPMSSLTLSCDIILIALCRRIFQKNSMDLHWAKVRKVRKVNIGLTRASARRAWVASVRCGYRWKAVKKIQQRQRSGARVTGHDIRTFSTWEGEGEDEQIGLGKDQGSVIGGKGWIRTLERTEEFHLWLRNCYVMIGREYRVRALAGEGVPSNQERFTTRARVWQAICAKEVDQG